MTCPERLALEDDFEGVVDLLSRLRRLGRTKREAPTLIDFSAIRQVRPSGALVLAAEIDRRNGLPVNRFRRFGRAATEEWRPNVRRLLGEMGFFDLLHVSTDVLDDEAIESAGPRYVKFLSGRKADGEAFEDLRANHLQPFIEVPNGDLLYAAVSEAMTNVGQHAYKRSGHLPDGLKRWWISAAYDAEQGELVILIYDQGRGIPQTLPRKLGDQLRASVGREHAQLIRAAHELHRAASEESHRGLVCNRT